jgi:radical SAM-linked protein
MRVAPGEFRLRVAYAKSGRLRYLSHLEVVHALERAVRRAGLEYAVTQGFSPHMKVAFGPALPVGTAGDDEFYEVWLTRYTRADDALTRLTASTPVDLAPKQAVFVLDSAPSLGACLTIAKYELVLGLEEGAAKEVRDGIAAIVSNGELTTEHKGKQKVFDLARSLPEEVRVDVAESSVIVRMAVRMGPQGSLRPEALVKSALAAAGLEPSFARTTRTQTLIETDDGEWARPV